MNITVLQQEIDAILRALNAAKAYAGLGPEDPSVVALEQIMMTKVAALEAAKLKAIAETQAVQITATSSTLPTAAAKLSLAAASEGASGRPDGETDPTSWREST